MQASVIYDLLVPFVGTSLGSACVFFLKKDSGDRVQRGLAGFASGVMMTTSIWSLLIPVMDQSAGTGTWIFLPAVIGFWVGILSLLGLDHLIPRLHQKSSRVEGPHAQLRRSIMMVLAVTLHDIPEGMTAGVIYAGYLAGDGRITMMGALALSLGIAIQNFPEGAVISMPLRMEGISKPWTLAGGILSGAVKLLDALPTVLASRLVALAFPYLLSFATGAIIYVVVEELIPEMSQGEYSDVGALTFVLGFTLMMALDVALG